MPHSFTRKNVTMTREEDLIREKRRIAKKRRRNRILVFYLMALLLIVAISFCVMLAYEKKQLKDQLAGMTAERDGLIADMNSNYITNEAASKLVADAVLQAENGKSDEGRQQLKDEMLDMFEQGDGVLTVLENVYAEKIVVPDSAGYYFYDVDESLNKHGLDFDKFEYPIVNEETGESEGEIAYIDDSVTVKKGIDVSKFQGKIDWEKVKKEGIEFALIRCGYRGYETGKIVEDETFEENIKACKEIGMDAGVYFFTEAKSVAEGKEEADFVIDLLKEYEAEIQLPIVIDVEQSSNPNKSRKKNLTPDEITDIVIAFCERVKAAGYEPMIYGNLKSHMRMTDIYKLEEYPKWFAYYRTPLRYPYKFDIWQYTAAGSVNGIKGDVDINLMFVRTE